MAYIILLIFFVVACACCVPLLFYVGIALLILLPGSLAVFVTTQAAGWTLDLGQVITFSLLAAVPFFLLSALVMRCLGRTRSWFADDGPFIALVGQGAVGGVILIALLVAQFGLHQPVGSDMIRWASGDKPKVVQRQP